MSMPFIVDIINYKNEFKSLIVKEALTYFIKNCSKKPYQFNMSKEIKKFISNFTCTGKNHVLFSGWLSEHVRIPNYILI